MNSFKVWAPHAKTVEVEVCGSRHRMSALAEGWWRAEISSSESNADYGFVLDRAHRSPIRVRPGNRGVFTDLRAG
jgi:1,4-alpha-glucan branching enzyme